MIGGIIILTLFLIALVAMVLVTQGYDSYQLLVAKRQRMTDDRFSEQLRAVMPGIATPSGTCTPGLDCYVMTISNLGIGTRIARIYINSTGGGCTGLCILNPSTNPAAFKFRQADAFLDSGEFFHEITFWLPAGSNLPSKCKIAGSSLDYGCNSITIVTARGRVFAFQYPIPIGGQGERGGAGGTGIYIGPVVYTFQKPLIAYSTTGVVTPQIPIGDVNGYWRLPVGTPLLIYIKLQTDNGTKNNVYMTAQSILEFVIYKSCPGCNPQQFYIVAPITLSLCAQFQTIDPTIICDQAYGYYADGNTGDIDKIVPYLPCNQPANLYNVTCTNRYMLPKPTYEQEQLRQRGNPVIVAFASNAICEGQNCPDKKGYLPNGYRVSISSAWRGTSATTFLGLTYSYDMGNGPYFYGVTLPFVAVCTYDPAFQLDKGGTCQG